MINTNKNIEDKNFLLSLRNQLQDKLINSAKEKNMTLNNLKKQLEYNNCNSNDLKLAISNLNEYKSYIIKYEDYITHDIKNLETNNSKLINTKTYIKSNNSIIRKIVSKDLKINFDNIINQIYDIIRYTIIIDEDKYINEVETYLNKLSNIGYQIIDDRFKNFWGNDIYQGINACLSTPYGIKIEIQFHTKDSYITKQFLNHTYYEIYRNPITTDYEKELSRKIMIINQSMVNVPKNTLGYSYKYPNKSLIKSSRW